MKGLRDTNLSPTASLSNIYSADTQADVFKSFSRQKSSMDLSAENSRQFNCRPKGMALANHEGCEKYGKVTWRVIHNPTRRSHKTAALQKPIIGEKVKFYC